MKRGDVSKGPRRCIQRPGSLPACTCAEHTANRRVTCAQPKHCIPFVLPRCDSCWRRGSSALNSEILCLSLPPNRAGGSPTGAATALAWPCQGAERQSPCPADAELFVLGRARRAVLGSPWSLDGAAGQGMSTSGRGGPRHPPTLVRGRPGKLSWAAGSSRSASLCRPPRSGLGCVEVQPFPQPWVGSWQLI